MAKIVYLNEIRKALAAEKCGNQWMRGCAELAGMIIDRADSVAADIDDLESELLNGAADWAEYAAGGCLYISDEAIAACLATPSEIRRRRNSRGELMDPNARETWMDVQGRAAFMAWQLIWRAAMNSINERAAVQAVAGR